MAPRSASGRTWVGDPKRRTCQLLLLLGGFCLAGLPALAGAPAGAADVTATLTISPGALGFLGTTPAVRFAATRPSAPAHGELVFDVSNPAGIAPTWEILATVSGTGLARRGVTINGLTASPACDLHSPCTPARSMQSYPRALSADGPPSVIFQSQPGTGIQNEQLYLGFTYATPAAATSSATWTFSLVSGP